MIRRARWGTFPLLLTPFGAWALGLGDIELRSALNQPLDANIEVASATPEELADLRVSLAAPETFGRYGLDRPGFLARINFTVTRDEAGRNVVRMSSVDPIAEPIVTVLVEATWNRGRLLREYTVFLDPPVMLPAEAVVEPIQPATARAPQPAQPAAVIQRPPVAPAPAPATAGTPPPRPAAAPGAGAGTYGPVQRGDTLWGIAAQFRPNGVTMNQMMVAMYQANPAAFQGNMNVLRQGATLNVPTPAAVAELSANAATQEVARQEASWTGSTGEQQARLRLLAPEAGATTPAAANGGAGTGAATGQNTAALENELGAVRNELAEAQRLLALRNQELSNLQQQLSEARAAQATGAAEPAPEPTVVDPGVDLEADEIFADEAEPVVQPVEPAPVVAEPPAPVVTAPAPSQVVSSTPAPTLLSRVLGWLTTPLVWMLVGLGALVGAGVWYLRTRQAEGEDITGRWEALEADVDAEADAAHEATARLRADAARRHDQTIVVEEQLTQELPQATEAADDEDMFDIGEDLGEDLAEAISLPGLESEPETAPERATAELPSFQPPPAEDTLSSQTVINLDQADPIAEADFHMAYGLYDQAADLISKALEANPENRSLRLKLLEVYFVWGNREAFLDTARILRAAIGEDADPDWDKIVIMGKQICPDEALFADATAAAGSIDLDLAAGDSPALDLAFDEESAAAMDLDLSDDADGVTLELESSGGSDSDDDGFDIGEATGADDDLDIGAETAAGLEAAFIESRPDASAKTSPNLDIDTAAHAAETARSRTLDAETLESPTLEFDSGEAPTVEALGPDAPTMESPQLDSGADDDDDDLQTVEQPLLESAEIEDGERTAEIDLDDLGLDVNDLVELDVDPDSDSVDIADADVGNADVLSATGVTQVLSVGDDADVDVDDADADDDENTALFARTEVLPHRDHRASSDATAQIGASGTKSPADTDLDIDLDELSAALDGADTVEQPAARGFSGEIFGDDGPTDLDLDVGAEANGRDNSTATEEMSSLEPQTLTEVGTKLDLARAYIDMGDPDGARSILEEVLDEGDNIQKQEAKGLIDAL